MSRTIASRVGARAAMLLAALAFLLPCTFALGKGTRAAENNEPFPSATPRTVVDVSQRIFPAVVRLDVAQEIYSEGKRTVQRGIGSGVIIDEKGRILTNFHVAGRAAEIFVTLYSKERVHGTLVGDDHWTDLAVVQMDMDEISKKKVDFRYAELGESKGLIVGQDVMAIGTPFGLARTMTLGIVSNNERTFYPERMRIDEYETGTFNNWIQMDTPINPGNSGGPLVDMTGKVIGINTRGGGQNLNFAIPIDVAKEVISRILTTAKDGKKGRVDRSDLGIDFKPLQDLETFYNIDINRGVLVNSVDRNSPAEKAGVKSQDILLDVNEKPVNVRFPEEIAAARKMIADLPIGTDVNLTLKRSGKTITLTAKTEKLQGVVGEEKEFKSWGISVRELTRAYANEARLDDTQGVVVTTLNIGYPAEKAGLDRGDVIRSVNRKPVTDLDSFSALYDASIKKKDKVVVLEVQRGQGRHASVLKVNYDEE
ncbi:MAG TPA: trypsin-like peptidase domain-containing protein [Tepidisphaeraceae bacterium]|nr:trypsin-like peptidase domain-containing protein [Tepidisphaeraceae bacterium]